MSPKHFKGNKKQLLQTSDTAKGERQWNHFTLPITNTVAQEWLLVCNHYTVLRWEKDLAHCRS